MALKIDEEWIRQRVHLKHDNLDDVKSLSLPGSYHEKIAYLGTSLHSFTRLKHLDLSRNLICSLEGVSHLQMLETLNLYYNNILALKDLFQLRTLTNLKELDIRLNPVAKNEPDLRLFLIHMLPNLKKLDDRSVRDSERKAALMHFNTDQATEFTDATHANEYSDFSHRLPVPRAELVRSLGPRSTLYNDDVALLDAIARTDGDFHARQVISGSHNKVPAIQEYDKRDLVNMHQRDKETSEKPQRVNVQSPDDLINNVKPSPNLPPSKSKRAPPDSVYAPYSALGNFTATPRPEAQYECPNRDYDQPESNCESVESSQDSLGRLNGRELPNDQRPAFHSTEERLLPYDQNSTTHDSHGDQALPMDRRKISCEDLRLLDKLSDLVDKYWNGTKSLHNHRKFQDLAVDILKSYRPLAELPERDTTGLKELRQEMAVKEEELTRLAEKFARKEQECSEFRKELEKEKAKQKQQEETQEEFANLRAKFQQVKEENHSLLLQLDSEKNAAFERQKDFDEAITGYRALQQENQKQKQRLEQQHANLQQLNELANMLQESHRSLVATNDHLLLELSEEKNRHQSEVNQLHWSYKQLKRSVDWIPSAEQKQNKT